MKQKFVKATGISIAAVLILIAGTIPAAARQARVGSGLESLLKCRIGLNDRERLACYDRAAAALATDGAGDRPLSSPPPFGLRAGRARSLPPAVDALDGKVVRVVATDRIRFAVTLADGSVWRTTEATRSEPAVGDAVHIRRAALGSYLASFAKARSVRIVRVR